MVAAFVFHCHILLHEDLGMMHKIYPAIKGNGGCLRVAPEAGSMGSAMSPWSLWVRLCKIIHVDKQ